MTETAIEKYPLVEKPARDFIEDAETIIKEYREEDKKNRAAVEKAATEYEAAKRNYEEAKYSYENGIQLKTANKYAAMLEQAAARHGAKAKHPEDIHEVCQRIIWPKDLFGSTSPKSKLFDFQSKAEIRIANETIKKMNAQRRARRSGRSSGVC